MQTNVTRLDPLTQPRFASLVEAFQLLGYQPPLARVAAKRYLDARGTR